MTIMEKQKKDLLEIAGAEVLFEEPMSSHSTIRIGGPAEALVCPRDVEVLKAVMKFAVEQEMPYCFWGAGSDTLVRDNGFKGVVIVLGSQFKELSVIQESGQDVYLSCGAGVNTQALVKYSSENGFAGVECLAGIPGSIGGNILTNAGTATGCIADVVEEITVVEKQIREMTIKRKALEFSYRNLRLPRSTAVIKVLFKLTRDDPAAVKNRVNSLMETRKQTQPYDRPTLGCIFKNPEIKKNDGSVASQSAGALIDDAGLKGVRVGRARVSEMHANFIVNDNGATARDVEVLIGLVKERVKQKFGVNLETEIRIIGES